MKELLNIFAGVALLVWGSSLVRTSILRLLGPSLRNTLSRSVASRPLAFLSGLGVTGLVQSSTATTLMTTSFVAEGLIAPQAALVIVLGADVGSAVVAQIFSLDLSWLSPLLIVAGIVLVLANKTTRAAQAGRVMLGLGLMLHALQLIMQAARPITESELMDVLLHTLSTDPLSGIVLGAVLTVLTHSSLAMVLLVAALATAGLIALPYALLLVLGINIGAALPVLIATYKTGATTRSIPVGNLIFKSTGCVIFYLLLDPLVAVLGRFALGPQEVVLLFHMLFNTTIAVIFFFLVGPVARISLKLVPGEKETENPARPRYLNNIALETPALAMASATREVLRLGDLVDEMLQDAMVVFRDNDAVLLERVRHMDDMVDELYGAIKLYLIQISRDAMSEREGQRWTEIISFTINLEHIGDIIDRHLMDLAKKKIEANLSFSEEGWQEISDFHQHIVGNFQLALSCFVSQDAKAAERLLQEKEKLRDLERVYADKHLRRLAAQGAQTVQTSGMHLDVISDLKRINSHICSVAYPVLDAAGALSRTRLATRLLESDAGHGASPASPNNPTSH